MGAARTQRRTFIVSRGARASQVRRLLVAGGRGWRWVRLEARPHPCARVIGSALPPPGWLGEVMAAGRLSRGCGGPVLGGRWLGAWSRWED